MSTATATPPTEYREDQFTTLSDTAPIRLRPAMFIGSARTDGLHRLVEELLHHPVKCFADGECRRIDICLFSDERCSIQEDARPFPVSRMPASDLTGVETLFTRWLCGGYLDGFVVVNALSDSLAVEVRTGGRRYGFTAARGVLTSRLADLGATTDSGNTITFRPDPEIFGTHTFDAERLAGRLKQIAYLNAGLRLSLEIEATGKRHEFFSLNGLADYVRELTRYQVPLHDVIHFQRTVGEVVIEVALQWCQTDDAGTILCFMNGEAARDGGTPSSGLVSGVMKCLLRFQNSLNDGNRIRKFAGADIRDGFTAIVSVRHPDPQWKGACRTVIGNPELEKMVAGVVNGELGDYFVTDSELAQRIWDKCAMSHRARTLAEYARTHVGGERRQVRRPQPSRTTQPPPPLPAGERSPR